jgi:glycosyltransferase involved in cell wall biosynthesis
LKSPLEPHGLETTHEVDLSLFVPCFNEEKRVVSTIRTIEAAMSELGCSYEIVVVDDGSTDNTFEVVREYSKANPEVPLHLHRNPYNLGLARTFVDTAFRGRGEYYRLVCGDDVEPKEAIVAICRNMGKAEIIVPYHPVLPGKSNFRRLVSKTYTLLVNLISGYSLQYYNGCALYRRFHVMRWAPYTYGFGFQADLITRLLDEGITYFEVPVNVSHVTKEGGGSALNLRNFVSTGHTLFEIVLRRLRRVLYGSKSPHAPKTEDESLS